MITVTEMETEEIRVAREVKTATIVAQEVQVKIPTEIIRNLRRTKRAKRTRKVIVQENLLKKMSKDR